MKKCFLLECKIARKMNDRNGKKYIIFELEDDDVVKVCKQHLFSAQFLKNEKIMNPLDSNSLEVKVPYRYNRVMCKMFGSKTIHELDIGDTVEVEIEYGGVWNIGEWCGYSWKLNQLNLSTKEYSLIQ
jgi:hypothetical protein